MTTNSPEITKTQLDFVLHWFRTTFRSNPILPIESQFPNFQLPSAVQAVLKLTDEIGRIFKEMDDSAPIPTSILKDKLATAGSDCLRLFRQMVLLFRRYRAAETERLREKTFHPELVTTVEADLLALDNL